MDCLQILAGHRPRPPTMKKMMSIIVGLAMGIMFVVWVSTYSPSRTAACLSPSINCLRNPHRHPAREYTDEERASLVVTKEILNTVPLKSKNQKVAFMFLNPGSLPFEKLWDKFFQKLWNKSLPNTAAGPPPTAHRPPPPPSANGLWVAILWRRSAVTVSGRTTVVWWSCGSRATIVRWSCGDGQRLAIRE